jgi:hypothetical protein
LFGTLKTQNLPCCFIDHLIRLRLVYVRSVARHRVAVDSAPLLAIAIPAAVGARAALVAILEGQAWDDRQGVHGDGAIFLTLVAAELTKSAAIGLAFSHGFISRSF